MYKYSYILLIIIYVYNNYLLVNPIHRFIVYSVNYKSMTLYDTLFYSNLKQDFLLHKFDQ